VERRAFLQKCTALALTCRARADAKFDVAAFDRARVLRDSQKYLADKPVSVTAAQSKRSAGGPHDFFSEGDYWWPDPKNPGGPYIQRDGMTNPDNFVEHRKFLMKLSVQMPALTAVWRLTKGRRYADHAAAHLRTWFVDESTRMNPNLQYAQAIHGRTTGRGTGVIDTIHLVEVAKAAPFVAQSGALSKSDFGAVKKWFADYTKWMTTSPKGLDEKKSGNNHATWWTAQSAAYATLVGDAAAKSMAWDHYRSYLVPTEIQPDGSCPKEEARTQSLGYSAMNLDAFAVLCRIAETNGVSLWKFRTPQGTGVETAFRYLTPFVAHPETWRKPQITKYSADGTIFPGLAGAGLHDDALLGAYRSLPRSEAAWAQFVDLAVGI